VAFSVIPDSIDEFAADVQGLADVTGYGGVCAAVSGQQYVMENIKVGYTGATGLFFLVGGKTEEVQQTLLDALSKLGTALNGSAAELRKTADNYAAIDEAARVRLDNAYPDSGAGGGEPIFTCTIEPKSPSFALKPPQEFPDPDIMTQLWTHNWFSPTETLAFVIEKVTGGFNFYDELAKRFSGEWNTLEKVASALTYLADFHVSLGNAATQESSNTMNDWTGEAATAVSVYFDKFNTSTTGLAGTLDELSNAYVSMAIGMAALGDLIAGLMAQLMDQMLLAALTAAAAVVTSETIIGGIVFGALTVMEVTQCVSLFHKIVEAIGDATTKWDSFAAGVGVIQSLIVDGSIDFKAPVAYDNPQV